MWSGIIKKAKDIIVGDHLIDDKGNSVRVKSTCSGEKAMYEVVPKKVNFMSHTVTDNHILTLKARNHMMAASYKRHTSNYDEEIFQKFTEKIKLTVKLIMNKEVISLFINLEKEVILQKLLMVKSAILVMDI
jgi:hypothetical protein